MNRYNKYAYEEFEREYEPMPGRTNVFYEMEELEEVISDKEEQLTELESELRQLSRELRDLKGSLSRLNGM